MTRASKSEGQGGRPACALWLGRCALGALLLAGVAPARAAEAASEAAPAKAGEAGAGLTPEQMFEGGTNTYNNWVEFSTGGFLIKGDAGQAEQREHLQRGAFGGIEDLHVEGNIDKTTTLAVDGHSLFDDHDYRLSLNLKREHTGYVRLSFENFRTWSDSAGGYFPPDKLQFSRSDEALALDRGQISFEAGLTLKDLPKVTFQYTHRYRDGQKSSTVWGPAQTSLGTRNLAPGFEDIDEKSDIFQLDVTHRLKATDLGVGLRYETGSLDNALLTTSRPGEPVERRITDRQGTDYDLFNVHAFSETWLKKDLFLSSGFLFENLDNTFSGSRLYGDDFDVGFSPNTLNGLGYFDLHGGSHLHEYVFNLNLLALPARHFTIVPSLRLDKQDWSADANGTGALGDFATAPFSSRSDRDQLEVRERVDLRYTGLTNWVFYAGPEWTQGSGNLKENGGLSQVNGIGVAPVHVATDDSRFFQKYFLGARWYPTRRVTVDAGGYYKLNQYDYDHTLDSTANDPTSVNRYPAYLALQNFQTYDGNLRLTLRPVQNVTLVSRYEYQLSTVRTAPEAVAGLSEVESARMTSHILAQNVSWIPWNRLSLQLGFNYVLSHTKTPAADLTQALLQAQNDYWTLNFNAGLVVDNKTDLNLGYFYYQSDDFQDNSGAGLPLGAAAQEHGVTATLTRRLSRHLRLNLKYAYAQFHDFASGGLNSYEGHLLFSSLQYRF